MEKNVKLKKTEETIKQVKSKKILRWTILNLFLILFGASVITNITYIPKYLHLKGQTDNALKINITAYDDTSNSRKLFLFQYQSMMATLGDLMGQYPENFHLTNNGSYGRYLEGISYTDDQGNNETLEQDVKNKNYWIIFIEGESILLGIDSLYLSMNDNIELHYQKAS